MPTGRHWHMSGKCMKKHVHVFVLCSILTISTDLSSDVLWPSLQIECLCHNLLKPCYTEYKYSR